MYSIPLALGIRLYRGGVHVVVYRYRYRYPGESLDLVLVSRGREQLACSPLTRGVGNAHAWMDGGLSCAATRICGRNRWGQCGRSRRPKGRRAAWPHWANRGCSRCAELAVRLYECFPDVQYVPHAPQTQALISTARAGGLQTVQCVIFFKLARVSSHSWGRLSRNQCAHRH